MTTPDVQTLVIGLLQGVVVGALFLLALFIGFCVMVGSLKLRPSGGKTLVVRCLDELVGEQAHARYLRPDAPRGTIDQLRTPELLEAAALKQS